MELRFFLGVLALLFVGGFIFDALDVDGSQSPRSFASIQNSHASIAR